MSGIQHTPQLDSHLQTAKLSDNDLNKFHAFSVTTLTNPQFKSRWLVSENYAAATHFSHAVWLQIFQYLTPKEIYSFMISARGWSQCIDLNLLRNQFVFLGLNTYREKTHDSFLSILPDNSRSEETHSIMHVESNYPLTFGTWTTIASKMPRPIHFNKVCIENAAELQLFLAQNNQQLPHLTEIDLERTKEITFADLQATLRAAPHLKALSLNVNDKTSLNSANLAMLEAGSLPALKALSLSNDITAEALQACLQAASHLKELSLTAYSTGFEFKALTRLFKNAPLVSLEKLVFNNSQIDMSQDLQAFLEIAPNLKSISILCANSINGDFTYLQPNSLPNLRRFCVFGPEFTMKDMQSVLLAAPNLKELDLLEYTENGAEEFPPLNLSLEKIRLDGHITNYLQALLRAAPHIKEVELHDDKINLESALSDLNIDSLPALTRFSLTKKDFTSEKYRPITTSDILSLLKLSPHLKAIALERSLEHAVWYGIETPKTEAETLDFSEFSGHCFPSLNNITLSNIDVENLQNLIEAIPNLEFIQQTPAPDYAIDPEQVEEESLISESESN